MIRILEAVARDEKRMRSLKLISAVCSYTLAAFFGCQLMVNLIDGLYLEILAAAGSAAVGFIAVSILRARLNFKRPYEVYDFYETPPRELAGRSFPSRHTYSAFAIATVSWMLSPLFFAGLMLLAVAIAVCRVVTGIHFVRDVLAGALIGATHGVIPIIICSIIC